MPPRLLFDLQASAYSSRATKDWPVPHSCAAWGAKIARSSPSIAAWWI